MSDLHYRSIEAIFDTSQSEILRSTSIEVPFGYIRPERVNEVLEHGFELVLFHEFLQTMVFQRIGFEAKFDEREEEEKEKSDSVRDQRNRWKLRFDSVALPRKNKETEDTWDSARQSVHRHFFWAARVSLVLCRE